jgi:FAD/FMN-containing dehydrogenase/Fe-S oxidoreductase
MNSKSISAIRTHGLSGTRPSPTLPNVDAVALSRRLKKRIKGEVRFDNGSRALYSTDSSNYRQVPIGVVIPRDKEDVIQTVAECRRFGAPILSRGGGTSLAGQCCNVAVVMDLSKYMHRVLEIDSQRRLARVEPGCVLDHLRDTAIAKAGLNFAPDPETHDHCTLGGMLGNNSCGVHSLMAKNNGIGLRVSDNTQEMEILTYEGHRFKVGPTSPEELERIIRAGGPQGDIYRKLRDFRDQYAERIRQGYPKLERRVSGYNLPDLLPENGCNIARALVGSESTLVTILEATLLLVPEPKARSMVVLGYPDIYTAGDHVMEILEFKPTGLEGMDHLLFKFVKDRGDKSANLALLPPGYGFLMVEFGGDSKEESDEQARRLMDHLKRTAGKNVPTMKLFDDPKEEEMIWKVREGGLGSTAWVPGMPDAWEGWEDSAVPVPKVGNYLRDLRKLLDKYDYHPTLYGHLGQGCIHTRIPFDLYTEAGIAKWRSFINEATDLVVRYGGSFSGEHGDGQSRGEWLVKMFGPELMEAMNEFKRIWDPQWKMNPGKVVDPYPMTSNLRLGPNYNPPEVQTHFSYPVDRHSFARAALRCVGIGECRKHGGQTMCPSYMATMEEKDCTRGRARLLWEMLNGAELRKGWKSDAVFDALDLCLSCKGCKHDCPVNVDMATYKAEFLSHYYKGRLRPRHAYAFGWIHIWSRLGSVMPRLANWFTHAPVLSALAKWMAGMEQTRKIPPFAGEPFKDWFFRQPQRNPNGPPVILWADTFNNYYHPDTARAAVEVLQDAGFRVQVPRANLCCGRPLYDYGFLSLAKRWLEQILVALQKEIREGVPMVVLEPSCCAVFRDELTNLFPNNEDAKKLHSQTFVLSEFLNQKAPHYEINRLDRKVLAHFHCHQKAVIGTGDEEAILKKLGLDVDIPEPGCCGMAGAFGFEQGDHYKVSVKCGERELLPAVRKSEPETLIIADGFSCHEQIAQLSGRQPLHLAQVLQMAIREGTPVEGAAHEAPPARRPIREVVPESAGQGDGGQSKAEKPVHHHRFRQWVAKAESFLGKHNRHE